jgi:hypothetical protein
MGTIRVIVEEMNSQAAKIREAVGRIKESQESIVGSLQGLQLDFCGKIPSIMMQNVSVIDSLFLGMSAKLEEHAAKIDLAAKTYKWSDHELEKWFLAVGVFAGYQMSREFKGVRNNPFDEGQCTWYAFGRSQELTGKEILWNPGQGGRDAANWPTRASNLGAVAGNPTVGNIMVWGPSEANDYHGHVAVVEKIEPIYGKDGEVIDHRILYSQANWDGDTEDPNPETDGIVTEVLLSALKGKGINLWEIT